MAKRTEKKQQTEAPLPKARKPRELDRDRPYAEVHGLPGAKYEQDGILFQSSGLEARAENLSPIIDDDPPVDPEEDNEIGVGVAQTISCPKGCECRVCLPPQEKASREAIPVEYGVEFDGDINAASKKKEKPAASAENVPFEEMHWTQLRKCLELYGEPWVDSATAIAFLRGKKLAA